MEEAEVFSLPSNKTAATIFSCLVLPDHKDFEDADAFIFSFFYEVTRESIKETKGYLTETDLNNNPIILRCKILTNNLAKGVSVDLCWLGLTTQQWEILCSKKGKVTPRFIGQFALLFQLPALQQYVRAMITVNARTRKPARKKTLNKLYITHYLGIAQQLFLMKRLMGDAEPLISWYVYVSYMISNCYVDLDSGLEFTPYNIHVALRIAINDFDWRSKYNSGEEEYAPSPITWISVITNSEYEFYPFLTHFPNEVIASCRTIITGGAKLIQEFGEVADSVVANNLESVKEKRIARQYSRYKTSVIQPNEVSLGSMSLTKQSVESLFYNVMEQHFTQLSSLKKPFRESEKTIEELKDNFLRKIKENDVRYMRKATDKKAELFPYRDLKKVEHRRMKVSPPSNSGVVPSAIGLGPTLDKFGIVNNLQNEDPTNFGLLGSMNWSNKPQMVSCFQEWRGFASSSSGSETIDKIMEKILPLLNPNCPTLKRFENSTYYSFVQVIDMDKFNKPFLGDSQLMEAVQAHLAKPCTKTFEEYCIRMLTIIDNYNYNFHEVIVPNSPVYAFSLDLDCHDIFLSERFHCEAAHMWTIQLEFFQFLKQIICVHFESWYGIPDMEETSTFAFYISIPDESRRSEVVARGIRGRLIWRSWRYFLDNARSAFNLTENLNSYLEKVLLLGNSCIFDPAVYDVGKDRYKLMRLPMCMKENRHNTMRPLIPLLYDENITFIPQFGMVHQKHSRFNEEEGMVVKIPRFKKQMSLRTLTENSLVLKKHLKGFEVEMTKSLDDEVFRGHLLNNLPAVKQFIKGKVVNNFDFVETSITPQSITYEHHGKYVLSRSVHACFKKNHEKWQNNPCCYKVQITERELDQEKRAEEDKRNETEYESRKGKRGTKRKLPVQKPRTELEFTVFGYCYGCGMEKMGSFVV